jgi:hypothetical protein
MGNRADGVVLIPNDKPKSRILMVAAWISDVIWIPAIAFGSPPVREIGFVGFVASLIFWWAMLSIYNKGKATGRYTNLGPRPWKDQVW